MDPPTKKQSKMHYLRYTLYLVPILAIVLGYAGIIVATGESYPFTIVLGPSMQPTILPGSVAMIDKIPFNELKVNDIIVFTPELALRFSCDSGPTNSLTSETAVPCFVIHRIVQISDSPNGTRILRTQGDNNAGSIPSIDTGINKSMYIGKVVLQFPEAGYITTSPTNEIIAVLILAALAAQLFFERSQSKRRSSASNAETHSGASQETPNPPQQKESS